MGIRGNLYLFGMAPRTFGDTWGLSHLISLEPCLKRPKGIDPNYQQEYDLCLPYTTGNIKVKLRLPERRIGIEQMNQ
jgi:hypothetical protein